MKFLFDLFPVILFFIAFKIYGIFVATAVAIAGTFLQIGWVWFKHRKVDLAKEGESPGERIVRHRGSRVCAATSLRAGLLAVRGLPEVDGSRPCRRRAHVEQPPPVAVRVEEAVRVHEAEILRLVVRRAAGGERSRDESIDLLPVLAGERLMSSCVLTELSFVSSIVPRCGAGRPRLRRIPPARRARGSASPR